jgi:hypothetical protein
VIKDNYRAFNAGWRFWELSGGILRCCECGWTMYAHTTPPFPNKRYYYYVCKAKYRKGPEFCPQAEPTEQRSSKRVCGKRFADTWKTPSNSAPTSIRAIELERSVVHGDPGREMKLWTEKLSEVGHKRAKYQEMAASALITFDELRSRLSELEETRRTAESELAALRNHQEHVQQMEQDRDALLESHMRIAPEALESLAPKERHQLYKMLRLEVTV